jgi:hypothetical protein
VIEQHIDGGSDPRPRKLVDGIENPKGLCEHQVGYPSTLSYELFSRFDLVAIVSDDEANKNVRVNREHIVGEYAFEWLPSRRESIWRSACHSQRAPGVSPTN